MKRKRTRSCVKFNKMPIKASKVKRKVKPSSASTASKCEKKIYCLFCYKLVNHNINHTSRESTPEKERVQTCDKFYKYLLRNSSKYTDKFGCEGKDETDKNYSSVSFAQIQEMCLGACNDCFCVIKICCTVFKEIEDLQANLKTTLNTLRSVMRDAGKVTPRMKLFRESFALAVIPNKKVKRKRKRSNGGPKKSLEEVLKFRQTIFETCKLQFLYLVSSSKYFEYEKGLNYNYFIIAFL